MTKSTGKSQARDMKCVAVGTPNTWLPSPMAQTTVRSGRASLAPSAAPGAHPSTPEWGWLKNVPGRRKHVCVGVQRYLRDDDVVIVQHVADAT